ALEFPFLEFRLCACSQLGCCGHAVLSIERLDALTPSGVTAVRMTAAKPRRVCEFDLRQDGRQKATAQRKADIDVAMAWAGNKTLQSKKPGCPNHVGRKPRKGWLSRRMRPI